MANPSISDLRLQLLSRGYHILPNRGKIPALPGWQTVEYLTRELAPVGAKGTLAGRIGRWVRRWPDALSTGLRIEDGLVVLDLDINDAGVVDVLLAGLPDEVLQRGPTRYGSGAKCAVFARHDPDEAPFIRRASRRYNGHCLEVFGGAKLSGDRCSRQFGIYGPHSFYDDGSVAIEYAWAEGVPALHQIDAAELPVITLQQIAALIDRFEALAQDAGWTADAAPDTDAGNVAYDITPETRFDTNRGETGIDYAGLCEAWAIHGQGLRCASNFMPGRGDSGRTDHCMVGDGNRFGVVGVWVHGDETLHLPAELETPELDAGKLAEQLNVLAKEHNIDLSTAVLSRGTLLKEDFYAFLPTHQYIYRYTGRLYPAATLDAVLNKVTVGTKTKKQTKKQLEAGDAPEMVAAQIPARLWLDRHKPVMEMSWAPGEGEVIQGRLAYEGGWIEKAGVATFNLYRPPPLVEGNSANAGRWLDFVELIYPDHVDHIVAFLAHRIQRPAEKINHGLVLIGAPRIGKDTLLEPLRHGVGPWNFKEVGPHAIMDPHNDFMRSVVLRVSEARDLGDVNRYAFYERAKPIMAAPPDMVRINTKFVPQYYIANATAAIVTSNYGADGLYLPADDGRHYVCGTELARNDDQDARCLAIWAWYAAGGVADVVAYLREYDLSAFNVKLPPVKTEAFWRLVDTGVASEVPEFQDALEATGEGVPPDAVTLDLVSIRAVRELQAWLQDPKNRRSIPHRMEACGYQAVRNQSDKQGKWKINGRRQVVYAHRRLSPGERYRAAELLKKELEHRAAMLKGKIVPFKPD